MASAAPEGAGAGPAGGEAELRSLRSQIRRLAARNQHLRASLRRARPAAALAGALHRDLISAAASPYTPRSGRDHPGAGRRLPESILLTPAAVEAQRDNEDAAAVFEEDGASFAEEQAELRAAGLAERLQDAEASLEDLDLEVSMLRSKLQEQESLEAEASDLIAKLCARGVSAQAAVSPRGRSAGGAPARDEASSPSRGRVLTAPPTARQAQLAQECAKLRHWASVLQREVAARSGAAAPAPAAASGAGAGPGQRGLAGRTARNEVRRLQQLEVIAQGLHEELKRLPSQSKDGAGAAGPPPKTVAPALPAQPPIIAARTAPPSAAAAQSLRGEQLERHIGSFCRRFALRRSALAAN